MTSCEFEQEFEDDDIRELTYEELVQLVDELLPDEFESDITDEELDALNLQEMEWNELESGYERYKRIVRELFAQIDDATAGVNDDED